MAAGREIEDALQRVRDKVDQAEPDIPPDAEDPMINEVNISEFPILFISLSGDVGLSTLTKLAEDLEEEFEIELMPRHYSFQIISTPESLEALRIGRANAEAGGATDAGSRGLSMLRKAKGS